MRLTLNKRNWWSWGQWLVIPLAIIILVELWVRRNFDEAPVWYSAAAKAAETNRIDVAFIGSSRVREGIYTPAFTEEVFKLTGQRPRAINLGRGYSTAAQHYFGLRNLSTTHPESVKGITVFIEAPAGLPAAERWTEPWVHESQPWLLVDLLKMQDLPAFLRSSANSAEDRVHLSFRAVLRNISMFNRRERVREQLLQANTLSQPYVLAQLSGSGGTRTDTASMNTARKLALENTARSMQHQEPLPDWDTSIVHDIVQLVKNNNGSVVFFDVPLSSPFQQLFATAIRRRDIAIFQTHADRWNTPILRPVVSYTDADLPDLWHSNLKLTERFTKELARTWAHMFLSDSADIGSIRMARRAGR